MVNDGEDAPQGGESDLTVTVPVAANHSQGKGPKSKMDIPRLFSMVFRCDRCSFLCCVLCSFLVLMMFWSRANLVLVASKDCKVSSVSGSGCN